MNLIHTVRPIPQLAPTPRYDLLTRTGPDAPLTVLASGLTHRKVSVAWNVAYRTKQVGQTLIIERSTK